MQSNSIRRSLALLLCALAALTAAAPVLAAETAEPIVSAVSDPRFDGKTLEEVVTDFRTREGLDEENFALSYRNTVTGEEYGFNDTKMMAAGSTYKLPLNLYYYKLEQEGAIEPDVTFEGNDLADAHYLSLRHSHNDVSIAMLYGLGAFWEYKTLMRIAFFTMPEEEIDPCYYEDNFYCTRMMLDALQVLYDWREAIPEAIEYLTEARPGEYFRRYVTECDVAHKYGSFEGAENDVAIIFADQPFLLAVFTQDVIGEEVCAQAARLLKDYTDYQYQKELAAAEAERIAAEQAEAERIAAEKAEAERIAAERAEAERIAAEQAEAERIAAEKVEAERIAAEKAEAERLLAEQAAEEAEAQRQAAEKAARTRKLAGIIILVALVVLTLGVFVAKSIFRSLGKVEKKG